MQHAIMILKIKRLKETIEKLEEKKDDIELERLGYKTELKRCRERIGQ